MVTVIMQPYLFPYIGYFQLMRAASKFVIYDDVSYIRGGWINRNRWLADGKPAFFTVPIKDASSFRAIAETEISDDGRWRDKLLRGFEQNYRKAPFFREAMGLFEPIVRMEEPRIARRAVASVMAVRSYLNLSTAMIESSSRFENAQMSGSERVIDVCRRVGTDCYINAVGGTALYSKAEFAAAGVELKFLRPRPIVYAQAGHPFVENLSILDVVAYNSVDEVRRFLTEYDLE